MTQATKRKTRARKSYEDRTGLSTRAAKLLISATFTRPATIEDVAANWDAINDETGYYVPSDLMNWSATFLKHQFARAPRDR